MQKTLHLDEGIWDLETGYGKKSCRVQGRGLRLWHQAEHPAAAHERGLRCHVVSATMPAEEVLACSQTGCFSRMVREILSR